MKCGKGVTSDELARLVGESADLNKAQTLVLVNILMARINDDDKEEMCASGIPGIITIETNGMRVLRELTKDCEGDDHE